MADDLDPVWKPLELSILSHPVNLPELDGSTISDELKEILNKRILQIRKEQLRYLCSHPEIRAIIRELLQNLLNRMPPADLLPKFIREFFGQCKYELQLKVERHINDLFNGRFKSPTELAESMDFSVLDIESHWYWSSEPSDADAK